MHVHQTQRLEQKPLNVQNVPIPQHALTSAKQHQNLRQIEQKRERQVQAQKRERKYLAEFQIQMLWHKGVQEHEQRKQPRDEENNIFSLLVS